MGSGNERVMEDPAPPSAVATVRRALALLLTEPRTVIGLVLTNLTIAIVQLAEPVLFGRVVDALASGQPPATLIAAWAGLGLLGILAGVATAVGADRFVHRRRLATMATAFERAITLPVGYHAGRGTGAVVRSILAGADAMFWQWLALLREQLSALIGVLLLVPVAVSMDARLAAVLGALAVAFVTLNVLIVRRTSTGQQAVEAYHNDVYSRIGDVIGNVTIVQSYTRLAAEQRAMRDLMGRLLRAQYPVLTWWGVLTILTGAASTISMVTVFALGAVLAQRGEVSVGEIVSFIAFAALLIGKLDHLSQFFMRAAQQVPAAAGLFRLIDQPAAVHESAGARELARVAGAVAYEDVAFRYPDSDQGVDGLGFAAAAGETIALVGPTGSGKTTTQASIVDTLISSVGGVHIVTIEEPTEYRFAQRPGSIVTQREVPTNVPSFQEGLRQALRQDPDVIVVGEMRDLETTRTAISAAETGHVVFGTLHTVSAAKTIDRLIEQFPGSERDQVRSQVSTSLLGVLCQQLIPRADGSGMIAAFEFMENSPGIANLIRSEKTEQIESTIQTSGQSLGMQLLDDHLFILVQQGKIDTNRAIERANRPDKLRARLRM